MTSEQQQEWRAAHRAKGLCKQCRSPAEPGKVLCSHHLQLRRTQDREAFHRRKRAGLCVVRGCNDPPLGERVRCQKHVEQMRKRNKACSRRIKREVLLHYSNGQCVCCGEDRWEFLSIDHIHGGGTKHRKEIHVGSFYRWLKQQGFPSGYQVLCMNCNFAKGKFGSCPHEREHEQSSNESA